MVNPYVLIATHARLSITKKNIECLLACGVNVILVVTDSGEFATFKNLFPSISVVHHGNLPLGAKWQCGIEVAKAVGADPLIINGSDDILHPEFFQEVAKAIESGSHFVGTRSWYIYDTNVVYHFNYLANLPLGGGRAYSKKMLDVINYSVFDISRNKQLDDLGYGNVLNSKLKYTILDKPYILSVKGDWPMLNPTHKFFATQNAKLIETIHKPGELLKEFKYKV